MSKLIYSLLFLLFPLQVNATVIYAVRIRIPIGESSLTGPVNPPMKISPAQLMFDMEPSCPGFTALLAVQYQGENSWSDAVYSNGAFYTADRPVIGLWVKIRQLVRFSQECNLSVVTLAQPQQPPPTAPPPTNPPTGPNPALEVETFAGSFDYAGGLSQYTVTLNGPFYAQRIEVLIPQFCTGVSVTDVAVVRRGQSTIANRVPGKFEIFKLDKPRVFDVIVVGLKGPVNSSCQVPVYVFDMAPP